MLVFSQKQIPIDIYQFWSQRSNFWTAATILLNKILYKSVGIWAQCTLKYIKSSKFAQKLWSFRFPSPLHLLLCTMEFYGGIYYFSLNRSAAHQDIKNSTLFPVSSKRNWMAVTFFKKEKIIMQMKIGILAYIGNGILLPNLFWQWEKIVIVIEKHFWNSKLEAKNLQKFWDH